MTELPNGWVETTISRLGSVVSGGTPSTKVLDYWGGDIVWFSPADLTGYTEKFIDSGAKNLTQEGLENSSAKLMPAGSVMFSSRAPIGYVAITTVEASTNQGFKSLVPSKEISANYVYHYFKASKQMAEERASGTTFLELSGRAFSALPIPVPPLNEQRRIVEKIENLFAELDKGEESLRTAKVRAGLYRQSLLQHAFEGHLTADWRAANPDKLEDPKTLLACIQSERDARYQQSLEDWKDAVKTWKDSGEGGKKPAKPRKPVAISVDELDPELFPDVPPSSRLQHLGNLNVDVFDGPFGSNLKTRDYTDSGVQVIRLENIGYGDFITAKESYVSVDKYETIKKHTVFPGDIVFSSFVTDGIRSALVPASIPYAVNKADCFAVHFHGKTVSNEYVAYLLQSKWVYKAVEGLIHGVGRPRINTTQLKEIQIPICSPAEQAEVVEQLDSKLSSLSVFEKQLDEQLLRSKALRQSILKRAFAGELVPQDPNDEPAAKLLERIAAEKAEAEKQTKLDRKKRPARKPKKRKPTVTDLIEVLKKEKGWISAAKAAQGLGIADGTSSDDVEAFFTQLKERIEAGEIEVNRRGDEDWLRLATVEAG